MTTYTNFFRLAMPPFDDMPWDQAVNGNMQIIDAALAQFSTIPNFRGLWLNSTLYSVGEKVLDSTSGIIWQAAVTHTSAAAPTTFTQDRAANPSYWGVSSGSAMTVSDTAPTAPTSGDLWYDSSGAQLYVFYSDANSSQWVIATNRQGIIGEAPNDGNVYGRQNSTWAVTNAVANVGRNYVHNSQMIIAQRGAGPFTANGAYTLDRWQLALSLDTVSVTQAVLSDAARAQIGDEQARVAMSAVVTGNAGAGAFSVIMQKCESVWRFAGKTVTVSFWAVANSGAPKIGITGFQVFGTGGSPSTIVALPIQVVTVGTVWTRYSVTLAIPSIIGKTIGSNNDDFTQIEFVFSSGATTFPTVGVQTNTFQIWGVQLEIGSVATPLEKPDPQQDLAKCQRFYQTGSAMIAGYNSAGAGIAYMYSFPVTMRSIPNVVLSNPSVINTGTPTAPATGAWGFQFQAIVTALASAFASATWTASADL